MKLNLACIRTTNFVNFGWIYSFVEYTSSYKELVTFHFCCLFSSIYFCYCNCCLQMYIVSLVFLDLWIIYSIVETKFMKKLLIFLIFEIFSSEIDRTKDFIIHKYICQLVSPFVILKERQTNLYELGLVNINGYFFII